MDVNDESMHDIKNEYNDLYQFFRLLRTYAKRVILLADRGEKLVGKLEKSYQDALLKGEGGKDG